MRYSSGVRYSRAKPVGSFRVFQPSARAVASHDETLKDAQKSAAYWTSSVSSPMEIQERFPSGKWVTVQVVQPKSSRTGSKRSHATKARAKPVTVSTRRSEPRDWTARQMTSGRRVVEKARGNKIARIFQGEGYWTVTLNRSEPRGPFETTGEITRQSAKTLAAAKSLGTRLLKG